jgi:hypothetical protein
LFRHDGLQLAKITSQCFLPLTLQFQSLTHEPIGITAGDHAILLLPGILFNQAPFASEDALQLYLVGT